MSATTSRKITELSQQVSQVEVAASKLITRLAERAAYASDEEYKEIRGLMSALRGLSGAVK